MSGDLSLKASKVISSGRNKIPKMPKTVRERLVVGAGWPHVMQVRTSGEALSEEAKKHDGSLDSIPQRLQR